MSKHPFFDKVKLPKVKRNLFDKSYENRLSCNMGMLIPLMCEELVPGDKYRVSPEILIRTAPMIAPIMHRVDIYTHTFFVPKRLIWNEFEDYISGGKDGTLNPVKPFLDLGYTLTKLADYDEPSYFGDGSLWDYLGLPTVSFNIAASPATNNHVHIDVLPFRAYQQIYNDYYRDPNLTNEVSFDKGSGQIMTLTDIYNLLTLRRRCWHKDYFTSALPFAQRGPEVALPLGGSAPVVGSSPFIQNPTINYSDTPSSELDVFTKIDGSLIGKPSGAGLVPDVVSISASGIGGLTADLSSATAVTINALRRASALQKFLERSALGGSRLIESNFAHFGVMGKDYRYQRAEYVGGSCQNLMVSEVLQNSATESPNTIKSGIAGSMAGHGLSASSNKPITYFAEEQGYLITILSVLPRASYQQGIPKMFSRFDRLDEFFPEFAHLGEQEIKKQELYFDYTATDNNLYNNQTFGYQSRFSDMKYRGDEVHGDFRSSLCFWHMGRMFNGGSTDPNYESTVKPSLSQSFVECYPTKRIFNVTLQSVHCLWVDSYIKIKALRPMPIFGTPSF